MGYERETNAKGERDYLAAAAKERQLASLKRGDEQPVRPNLGERGEVADQLAAMARALLPNLGEAVGVRPAAARREGVA